MEGSLGVHVAIVIKNKFHVHHYVYIPQVYGRSYFITRFVCSKDIITL